MQKNFYSGGRVLFLGWTEETVAEEKTKVPLSLLPGNVYVVDKVHDEKKRTTLEICGKIGKYSSKHFTAL